MDDPGLEQTWDDCCGRAAPSGTYHHGRIDLDGPVDWPDGARVRVVLAPAETSDAVGHFGIIGGFGLAGRCVAELFDQLQIAYAVVESNPSTVATQQSLGRRFICGDASDERTLRQAGLAEATLLALTMPDEAAVVRATQVAHRAKPDIYIVARTNYSSAGMRAQACGANEVVMAEKAVAVRFYDKFAYHLGLEYRKVR